MTRRVAEDERYHKMDVMIHEMEQGLQAMERSIGSIGRLDCLDWRNVSDFFGQDFL